MFGPLRRVSLDLGGIYILSDSPKCVCLDIGSVYMVSDH